MADDDVEVPVSEVLCEAMEYLSKLGANLRSRSDTLKETKIRKDKLKNVPAVQKAAKKVLTICELSKKSLDNVESGVQRIMAIVNAAQSTRSIGGKVAKRDSSKNSSPKSVHYFVYQSRKLKIAKQISLAHYMSVKVIAHRMSKSKIDRYPVYHSCKLFRSRLKEAEQERNKIYTSETASKDFLKEQSKNVKIDQSKHKKSSKTISDNSDVQKVRVGISADESNDSKSKSSQNLRKSDASKSDREFSESQKSMKCIPHSTESEHCKANQKNNRSRKLIYTDSSDNNSDSVQKSGSPEKSKTDKINSDKKSEANQEMEQECIKKMKNRLFDSDSSSDINYAKASCNKETQLKSPSNKKDDISKNGERKRSTSESDRRKNAIHKSDTSKPSFENKASQFENGKKSTNESQNSNKKTKHGRDGSAEKESSKKKNDNDVISLSTEDTDSILNEAEKSQNASDYDTDSKSKEESTKNEAIKPLIKCISLSKLLKPEVLKSKYTKESPKKVKRKTILGNSYDKPRIKVRYEGEEEFWAQKRKEVEAFKPKNLSVKITRLPSFTIEFLNTHGIAKVVHKDSIIFDKNNPSISKECEGQAHCGSSSPKSDKIDAIKNALLNDSDSDRSLVNLDSQAETVKKTLLKDSDSETVDKHDNVDSVPIKDKENKADEHSESVEESTSLVKNKPDNNVDCENPVDCNEKKSPDRTLKSQKQSNEMTPSKQLAKTSLLNDSSGGSHTSDIHKKGTTPQSKRKHIMESMHAKRMLLTYSSSETEDEELNKALKNIQSSLLDDISSEQVKAKKDRKRPLSSDSEDLSSNMRKRQNLCDSINSDSDKEIREKNGKSGDENFAAASNDSKTSSIKMGRSRDNPGGSSSHSDTQDDKDIDGLTNLNTLTKTHQRRKSGSSKSSSKKNSPIKKPLITGEGLLEAPSSSDEASEVEAELEEDLPPVPLSSLNGVASPHLAKDDLLVDSDSDSSAHKEEESEEVNKEEESSDTLENTKKKRRKVAISSDSEAGSSKRKDNDDSDAKISDFGDSDNESDVVKRKRKKKPVDSDASASSSEEGKKKRRRIKQINESDGSGSDSENEGRNKHGRKNIRKVMGKNQLEEATKKAAREEKERVARIAERQKMYNNLEFDESGKPDEVVLDKVVLDFDPETKEPLIEVDRGLVKKLKPHQANGIKFMWNACFESVKRIKKDRGSGCILAHCMGLGKTLQVISLTHTLLSHSKLTGVHRVLVVCPLSTVLNWVHEFRMWLRYADKEDDIDVYELSRHKQNSERAFQLSQWSKGGGVCVLGYEMFRNLSADNNKKYKKKMLKNFQEALVDPGPDLVVCDEGHLLKNEKTSLSQSMNRVKTLRRIVLTGTPLQNNLKEYYCMVQFVKPNLLGKYNEYLNRFVNPITNGQYTDSTEQDIRVMKRRSHVLHKMLDGAVQRRDYNVLAPFLPPKHEYVLFITLTEIQTKLYQHYLDNYSRRPLPGKSSGFLFPDFQSLQRIWTHPLVLKYNSERYEILQQKKRDKEEEDSEGSLRDFIDDDSSPEESSSEDSISDLSDMSDDSRKKKKKSMKKAKKEGRATTRRGTRANPVEIGQEEEPVELVEAKTDNPTEWWIPMVTEDLLEDMRNSNKLVLLFEILRQCEAIGDKLLVFSQSLYSLDLIEHFLGKVDEATQEGRVDEKLNNHVGMWSPGVDYFRLDGSTSCENRSIWCKNFNREDNPRARLFLISTRAGGLGINLVAANRVVIFDVSWNPSHDVQSIFRVYRFGQKKPCYVYRFLAMGTMEEKIYERQVTKQAISKRVIDEQQIDRHYAEHDLAELYKFEPTPPSARPVPNVPKDRFFAEMLKEHEALIYKFHEHDSLLENKEEETLSEEERKAAWEDFENEKNRPPPAPFPQLYNGMVPNMLVQQQQQLAYAALASMLRKDMPNVTEDQIRTMLPLIYGANPAMFGGYDYGLMQKLNDMYKYPQPGAMMNPGMMNPMNAGGGVMGGGGSSGLQYEPPWQRQQQQQQQMRLQQLMQQNQSMGAKFYAGGLGSRDPVAMALQQQRAREIMVGESRGRGRPPLQPRAALPPTADVVNLDSD